MFYHIPIICLLKRSPLTATQFRGSGDHRGMIQQTCGAKAAPALGIKSPCKNMQSFMLQNAARNSRLCVPPHVHTEPPYHCCNNRHMIRKSRNRQNRMSVSNPKNAETLNSENKKKSNFEKLSSLHPLHPNIPL